MVGLIAAGSELPVDSLKSERVIHDCCFVDVLRGSCVVRSLVYYDHVIKIYVGINVTDQEVFSTCIRLLGVLFGMCRIYVGINATTQEVFSITWIRE